MAEKKADLRISRTERYINEAFLKLLAKKPFEEITVQEIANEAQINRSTFYAHYLDKYDLLEQYSAKLFSQLEKLSTRSKNSSIENIINDLFDHIWQNSVFYKVMLKEEPEFRQQLQRKLYDSILSRINFLTDGAHLKDFEIPEDLLVTMFANYYSSACIGIISWWLETGMIYSPQHISKIFTKISISSMYEIFGLNLEQDRSE